MKEVSAIEFLQFIGKIIRKIDEKMEEEKKIPIGLKLLGKETLTTKDLVRIINKIAGRYIYYLDEKEKEELRLKGEKISLELLDEIKNLEKEKLIKFYLFNGYIL